MKGPTKAAAYVGAALCVAVFAYCFAAEHTQVLHQAAGASRSRMMAYLGLFIAAAIVLGVLIAYDVAHFCGRRAEEAVLQGGPPLGASSALEQAERLRGQHQSLEAIRLLREFLEKHPREWEVMAKIAELYYRDLKNYLAAALEYEELLKLRVPAEQWAWSALHLAKLYSRLNQPEKSVALLERLEKDYSRTVAAGRARKALEELRAPGSTGQADALMD